MALYLHEFSAMVQIKHFVGEYMGQIYIKFCVIYYQNLIIGAGIAPSSGAIYEEIYWATLETKH